jgi:esterase
MGGKIAATVALKYPHKVKSLAIMDISPINYSESDLQSVQDTINFLHKSEKELLHINTKEDLKSLLSSFTPDANLQAFLMSNIQPNSDNSGFLWKYHVHPFYEGISNILGFKEYTNTYDGPTVIIKAGRPT